MIYEYALDPEFVASWNRDQQRYFLDKFRKGCGRIVASYPRPKTWRKRVLLAADQWGSGLDQTRAVEIAQKLSENMNERRGSWEDGGKDWRYNAEQEHRRIPFHAIVADDDAVKDDLWCVRHKGVVRRRAREMAKAIAPALRNSMEIIFVDPYFNPQEKRFRQPLEAFLGQMLEKRPCDTPRRLEIHTAKERLDCSREFFKRQCQKLAGHIPESVEIRIRRLEERPNGQELHNRYVLTDIGGIIFPHGLDENNDRSSTDDVHLLSPAQWEKRWSQYGHGEEPYQDSPYGFCHSEKSVVIKGTKWTDTGRP